MNIKSVTVIGANDTIGRNISAILIIEEQKGEYGCIYNKYII